MVQQCHKGALHASRSAQEGENRVHCDASAQTYIYCISTYICTIYVLSVYIDPRTKSSSNFVESLKTESSSSRANQLSQ